MAKPQPLVATGGMDADFAGSEADFAKAFERFPEPDLLGLAVERLAGSVAILGHPGDITVSTAKDGEGAGDTPGDCGHRGLAPSRHIEGSGPRLHTPRRELSTDHPGTKAILR